MWLLILEAAGALAVLVFIVWWTMFSGRPPDRAEEESCSDDEARRL
jgi:hypothetical protein